jgi:hypothetical protein
VSLTLQRKLSNNKQPQSAATPITTTTLNQGNDQNESDEMSQKMLKNVTNHQIISKDASSGRNLSENYDSSDDNNNTSSSGHNNQRHFENMENDENNLIAGSLNSADSVASKLSELINTNLPQLESSINNHLFSSPGTTTAANNSDLGESKVSDETITNANVSRNSSTGGSAAANRRAVKKTRVRLSFFLLLLFLRNIELAVNSSNSWYKEGEIRKNSMKKAEKQRKFTLFGLIFEFSRDFTKIRMETNVPYLKLQVS